MRKLGAGVTNPDLDLATMEHIVDTLFSDHSIRVIEQYPETLREVYRSEAGGSCRFDAE